MTGNGSSRIGDPQGRGGPAQKAWQKCGVVIETPIRRCVTENFTVEALRPILKDNLYRGLIRETELTALIYQMDAYKTTKGVTAAIS